MFRLPTISLTNTIHRPFKYSQYKFSTNSMCYFHALKLSITITICPGAVLGKTIWGEGGPGPSSFGNYVLHRPTYVLFYIDVGVKVSAQSLKMSIGAKMAGLGKIWGPVPPGPNIEPPLEDVP